MKYAVVSSSTVAKSGNMSAKWHVANASDRSPYMVEAGKLRSARPDEWSKCIWLSRSEKVKIGKHVHAAHLATAKLKLELKKLNQRNLNEE